MVRQLSKIIIVSIVATAFLISPCMAGKGWDLYWVDPGKISAGIKAVNDKTGLVPVGISFHDKKVWFLFNTGKEINATNYFVQNISLSATDQQMQKRIQKKINEGWVPFDLTYSANHLVMLYLKCDIPIKAWKIVKSKTDWKSIENTVNSHKNFFPLGFTFKGKTAIILLIKSPKAGVAGWAIKNCGSKKKTLNAAVNQQVGKGYTPYGFEYKGGQVGVCFLK